MKKYKVFEISETFTTVLTAEKVEEKLNKESVNGWTLNSVVNYQQLGNTNKFFIILEKDTKDDNVG